MASPECSSHPFLLPFPAGERMADAFLCLAAATILVIMPLWLPAVGEEPVGEEPDQ